MQTLFSPDFYISNRKKLLESSKTDAILIPASSMLQKSADQAFPFRQDSNFYYLSGINEPDLILVYTNDTSFLIVPGLNSMRQIFDGQIDIEEIKKISGVDKVYAQKEGTKTLSDIVNKSKNIGLIFPSPNRLEPYGFYVQPTRRKLYTKVKKINSRTNLVDLRPILARQRMVKQPDEIKAIRYAVKVTKDAIDKVCKNISPEDINRTSQIDASLYSEFIENKTSGHAFEPTIASAKHATVIHSKGDHAIENSQFLVVDVGAEYLGYSADITRTIGIGKITPRHQAIYDSVKLVQEKAFKLLKPGIFIKDFEKQVETLIGNELIKLGLIEKIESRQIRKYYPHACTHSLGLDTHDNADYSLPIPVNMVMTVEPGIYIPEEGIGVRIEDDVLITKEGLSVL